MQRMERRATADARISSRRSVASSFAASRLFHHVSSASLRASSIISAILLLIISLPISIVSILSVALVLTRPVVLVEGMTGR